VRRAPDFSAPRNFPPPRRFSNSVEKPHPPNLFRVIDFPPLWHFDDDMQVVDDDRVCLDVDPRETRDAPDHIKQPLPFLVHALFVRQKQWLLSNATWLSP
jgi:hypothetical protein